MSKVESAVWDFSPVFDLIHNLSRDEAAVQAPSSPTAYKTELVTGLEARNNQQYGTEKSEGLALGDLSSLWDYLGLQRDLPPPSFPPFEASTATQKQGADAYASDGALYYPPSSKTVQWRDEAGAGIDLADTQPESPPPSNRQQSLTKNQRKNLRRRERREEDQIRWELASRLVRKKKSDKQSTSSESEEPQHPLAQPGSVHGAIRRDLLRELGTIDTNNVHADQQSRLRSGKILQAHESLRPSQLSPKANKRDRVNKDNKVNQQDEPVNQNDKPSTPLRQPATAIHESLQQQWPLASSSASWMQLQPATPVDQSNISSINPPPNTAPAPKSTKDTTTATFPTFNLQAQTPTRIRHEILPLHHHKSEDRNWTLLLKLLHNYPQDRNSLLSPLQLSINRPQPSGIHIFVDSSNILIGFHQHLKRARGIPFHARVPRVYPNFHALALLLERRRPVAKRVLAGSMPEVPAFEEARQVGYETCILDKVWKAKELTEKQRRFAAKALSGINGNLSGYESGGESGNTSAHSQRPRWVEQAVDEIIHLKMLESLVDTPVPPADAPGAVAPTMVLATGDAAEAEYSSGFMKMVQRALGKGWNVEVAAWGSSISLDYRRMEKKAEGKNNFRIIELDGYAEELFSESAQS